VRGKSIVRGPAVAGWLDLSFLADKISGNQVGIWLLAPEHLRLGTWDLLCAWSQCDGQTLWPRMALHLVHEAALGVSGLRKDIAL